MAEDAFGRPMLNFDMPEPAETPADVEFQETTFPRSMFPSMQQEPKEPTTVEAAVLTPEVEAVQAEQPELVPYVPGEMKSYENIDVENLDMASLDRPTAYNIQSIRAGDFETVIQELMPDFISEETTEEQVTAYFQPLLDRLKNGEDPKRLTDWAIRALLWMKDNNKQKAKEHEADE